MTNPFNTDSTRLMHRYAGLAAIYYGAHIWWFDSFNHYSALSAWGTGPQIAFSLMLIVGGLMQFVGCWMLSRWTTIIGTALCLSVFLSAEYSTFSVEPQGTGVPAYIIISGLYALMVFCKMRDNSVPCAVPND